MKAVRLIGMLALFGVGMADVILDVKENGVPAGTVQWSVRMSGKEKIERQIIQPGSNMPRKTIVTHINAQGITTKVEFEMPSTAIIDGRAVKGTTKITANLFATKTVETIIRVPGRTIRQPILPSAVPAQDDSAFWFIRDHPKPGAAVYFGWFDIMNLKWIAIERTYVGRKPIPNAPIVGEANVVTEKRDGIESTLYLDDRGEPIVIESGTTRMVRR